MVSGHLLVATDVRLRQSSEGSILSTHPAALYKTFAPLTEVYGSVTLLAREAPIGLPSVGRAGGPGVGLAQVPDFTSRRTLVKALFPTLWRTWREAGRHDMVMGRLPEPLSLLVGWTSVLRRRPFIANVVADPTNPRLGAGILSRVADRVVLAATRGLVQRSAATIYVTESYLQGLCPPPSGPTLVRSNVRMDDTWFLSPREGALGSPPRVVLVGSNQNWDKGQLVLLDAAVLLAREGTTLDLSFVGGGQHVGRLREEAQRRGLPGEVAVLGQVDDREQLAAVLDEHDIFCLPSLSEGLPRAMVEAMARGLPAVGTIVGGIPELLPDDALCAPGDAASLSRALRTVIEDPDPHARSSAGVATARRVARQARTATLVEFLRHVSRDLLGERAWT